MRDKPAKTDRLAIMAEFPEQNPSPVLRVGFKGDLLYANPAARALLTAMGRMEDEPVPPAIRSLAAEAGRKSGIVQAELMDNKGRVYWFSAIRPGGKRYVNLYVLDITDRKQAEESLRQSREDLDRAQAVSQIGSWRLDTQKNILTWSAENHHIFEVPEGTPMSYEFFLSTVHPDDRRFVDTQWQAGLRGEPYDIEHRIVVGGKIKWVREKAYLEFDEAGTPLGGFGITQDVTERKQAEALRQALTEQEKLRLGAAVEQASDSVAMVDLDGTIRYVNAAFESINQIPREKAVCSSYFDFLSGESCGEAIREAIAKGSLWHGPLTRSIRDRRPVELKVTISPAKDPAGKVIGGLITEKDVTRENALERQVRQAQKMEALGTLAGGITHDFNNILGAITINTELALLDLDLSHPARMTLPLVLQAANRGKELVKQIITFSRQRAWERKPLEIVPIVKEGVKFLLSTLPKDIIIHETIDSGSGIVMADPSHIHQILVNLCQNASLAMKEGGGALEIKLEPAVVDASVVARHPDLRPGPYVRLTVADTGCGMTKELMERIFEPFFTTREPGGGSGLGLAVVHGIVKSYNGAITNYSEPGKGSVFNVYIPRLEGEAMAAGTAATLQPVRGEERILLVEDEEAQRRSLAQGLERLGYQVTARAEGRSAVTFFKKDPTAFDVVITDQIMPGMTGLELASALMKVRPDIPIILCTGFSEKVNGGTVGECGIQDFLMKPFTLPEITRLIRKVLKKENDAEQT